jgi:hypothetical protein
MALLKQILETYLSTVKEANIEGAESLIAATPNNQHKNAFSLIQNIHGSDLTTTDVTNHLKNVDDAEEEVDTVAFGLETTDGKIVKVYVNAEEAEAFEDKMSQLLGKIDDIDQAIEELSDEFDVVRVVKPDDLESEGGEEQEVDPSIGIENALDEPLGDDDIVVDMDDEDLIADPESEDKPKDGEDKNDDEEGDDKDDEEDKKDDEEGEPTDGLDFGVDPAPEDGEDKPEDDEEGKSEEEDEEDKPEGEDDTEGEDKPEDEEDDPKDDPKKDKKKKEKKPSKDDKDSKMKQEGTNSILKQLLALNEAKHVKVVHAKPKKEEPKKEEPKLAKNDGEGDTSADIFHLSLTKDEAELEQIFANPIQQLIYRTVLLLGVNADQINIRKFKVRKSVKEVSIVIQHHPQIKNILSKLGRDLASKKSEIHAIAEAEEKDGAPLTGTIKDQLSTEISKKIYDLILALGIPEFLLTYKKTAFRARIKNLAKIAVKHSRIKNYIYTLCDLLKAPKSSVREGFEQALEAQVVEAAKKEAPKFVSKGLLEDFSSTNNVADLGTFSITSMGKVGGTTLKVKDFSIELDDEQFEKFVGLLGDGKSGVVKSENLGKINLIALAHGKEYVVKKIKPSENDKYAFGVLISKKSIDKILG